MIQITGDTAEELSDLQTLIETGKLNYHEKKIKVYTTFKLSSGNTLLADQYNHIIGEKKSEGMKGYKAFNKNLTCNNFQYEIGQTYEMDGEINCCVRGFHFCKDLVECYRFYQMSEDTRICEIEALGEIKTEDEIKYCTNKIKILSEVKNPRIKTNTNESSTGYCNAGAGNTGNWNNGDFNSGYYNRGNYNTGGSNCGDYNDGDMNRGRCNVGTMNSGNFNSGDFNRGDYNHGNLNSGSFNTGDSNSGYWNRGNFNSGRRNYGNRNSGDYNFGRGNAGDYNSGNCNSGDWNKGNHNVGIFNCDIEPKIKIFDKESDWTMNDWYKSKAYKVMADCPHYLCYEYDNEHDADDDDDVVPEDKQEWWDKLSEDDKNAVKELPNFDADKFYLCTGIKV